MKNKLYTTFLLYGLTALSLTTGCNQVSKTTENTTETIIEQPKVDTSIGYDSSEDVLNTFSKIFYNDMTKDELAKCVYPNIENSTDTVDTIFDTIKTLKSTVIFNGNTIKYYSVDMDAKSLSAFGYNDASAVKTNRINILGETSNETADVNSLYSFDIYTVCINDRWFITNLSVLTDTTVINENVKIDLTTVDSSIETPAKLGQWVKTTVKEPESQQEIEVLVKITNVLNDKNTLDAINNSTTSLDKDLEYSAFEYQVYCENSIIFTTIPNIDFSIYTENNDVIDIIDLSVNTENASNSNIIKTGIMVFAKQTNNEFLIQVNPQSQPAYISLTNIEPESTEN